MRCHIYHLPPGHGRQDAPQDHLGSGQDGGSVEALEKWNRLSVRKRLSNFKLTGFFFRLLERKYTYEQRGQQKERVLTMKYHEIVGLCFFPANSNSGILQVTKCDKQWGLVNQQTSG